MMMTISFGASVNLIFLHLPSPLHSFFFSSLFSFLLFFFFFLLPCVRPEQLEAEFVVVRLLLDLDPRVAPERARPELGDARGRLPPVPNGHNGRKKESMPTQWRIC